MTSTRLTTDIRNRLTNDILRHRFAADVDALIVAQGEFALKVYNDIFSANKQEAMNSLPEGWLPESHDIGAQFGYSDGGGRFARLWFSGYLTGILGRLQTRQDDGRITKRVLASKSHGAAKVYDPSHPLAIEFGRLRNRTKDLKSAATEAEQSVTVALNKVTTISRLIEIWPEVETFARKYEVGAPSLPALPTNTLNEMLRLP